MKDNTQIINQWIEEKLEEIATKLPTLVHADPASFSCGFNTGYKQAILDLDNLIEHEDKYNP